MPRKKGCQKRCGRREERAFVTPHQYTMIFLPCSFGSTVIIGEGLDFSALFKEHLPPATAHVAVITDATVAKLHAQRIGEALDLLEIEHAIFPFPAGERFKTRKTKEHLEDLLLHRNYGKDCTVIGFGGGVVTDMAGFLAATFCRGVPFLAIPTTLMGMVDAGIGGKVAVNTPIAKNAIGAFYPAQTILIDPVFLSTLSKEEIQSGLAEVYKHALIASPELLTMLESPNNWPSIIEKSCAIKIELVESDFREDGRRRILNFGHTIGHALETASDYKISHGFAVAAGMRAESWLSHALGYLSSDDFALIEKALSLFPSLPSFPRKKIYEALSHDKKGLRSTARFVLLEKIGLPLYCQGQYCQSIEPELIEEAICHVCPL